MKQVESAVNLQRAHCLVVTSPVAFFTLVQGHVTESMASADYAKIGEYDEVTAGARGVPLAAPRWQWLAAPPWFENSLLRVLLSRSPNGPEERVLRLGYQGFDEEGEDDEKWLHYFPGTEELERRLRVVGAAMRGRRRG